MDVRQDTSGAPEVDIVSRYGADHPVGRSVTAHRLALLALGSRFDPPPPYVHDERDEYVEAPR